MTVSGAGTGVQVNGSILEAARSRVGLSRREAAERATEEVGRYMDGAVLTAQDIAAIERGDRLASVAEAEALAGICFVRYLDLFGAELPSRPWRDFRRPAGASSTLSYAAYQRIDLFDRLYEVTHRVTSLLSRDEQIALPSVRGSSPETADLGALADETRSALGVGTVEQASWDGEADALSGWVRAIEDLGVSVFRIPMPVDELRGLSRWDPGGPPAVALNTADSPASQMFTLHHELGHLILRVDSGTLCDPHVRAPRNEERAANALAAEVLVPSAELLGALPPESGVWPRSFRDWPVGIRKDLRDRFCVSAAVIGIRLQELGVVADSGYKPYWHTAMGRPRGGGSSVYKRYRRYLGDHASRLISHALLDERISIAEIARTLRLKASDVELIAG